MEPPDFMKIGLILGAIRQHREQSPNYQEKETVYAAEDFCPQRGTQNSSLCKDGAGTLHLDVHDEQIHASTSWT